MQKSLIVSLLVTTVIAAFIAGCGGTKDDLPRNALSATPSSLRWESAINGQEAGVKKVVITNTTDVEITGIDYKLEKNQSSIFLVGSDCTESLAPKATCNVSVNFKPDQSLKSYSDKYVFTYLSKTGESTSAIRLIGDSFSATAVETLVQDLYISGVTGSHDNFQLSKVLESTVGTSSDEGAITLKYVGAAHVSVRAIETAGTNFSVRDSCAGVLSNNQSCNMFFTYLPSVDGESETTFKLIIIKDGEHEVAKEITLKVLGSATLPSKSYELSLIMGAGNVFVDTKVGTLDPAQKTATLINQTGGTLYFRALSTSGAFPVTFDNCTGVLEDDESCTLKTTFAPLKLGQDAAYIRVVAGTKTTYVKVEGTGTTSEVITANSKIKVTPEKLDFPLTELGFQSATKRVTLTATTDDNHSVGFDITPLIKSQVFRYTTSCITGAPLLLDESCHINITYVPSDAHPDNATLKVSFKNTAGAEQDNISIPLTGTSKVKVDGNLKTPIPGVTVSTKRYAYPDTALGLTSLFTFTVTNNGSETVTGFRSTSTDLINFPLDKEFTKCGSTIPAGDNCTISYRFIARSTSIKTAYISLWADGVEPDNQIIEISGKGTLFNKYLNFGYVKDAPKVLSMAYVNDTQDAQIIKTITVKNLTTKWNWDNATRTTIDYFKSDNFSEDNITINPPFVMLSNDCAGRTLVHQDSCIIRIQFDPAKAADNNSTAYRARIFLENDGGVLKNNGKIVGQFHATASTEESRIMYFPTDSETSGAPVFASPLSTSNDPASQAQIDAITGVIGENYYVYGGVSDYAGYRPGRDLDGDPNVSKIRVYDAARNMWRALAPSGKSPLQFYNRVMHGAASSAVVNSKLYIFGGLIRARGNGAAIMTNDVFVYDPVDVSISRDGAWTKLVTTGTTPRQKQGASAGSLGGYLFIFGGYLSNDSLINEFSALDLRDPANPTWVSIPSGANTPAARSNAAMTVYNDKLYLHGGNDSLVNIPATSALKEANDLWEYTPVFDETTGNLKPAEGKWKKIYAGDGVQTPDVVRDDVRPSVRIKHSMSVVNGKLIIAGQGFIWPNVAVKEYKKNYFIVNPEKANSDASNAMEIFTLFTVANNDDLLKLGRETTDKVAGHYSAAIEGVFWFYNVNIMGLFMDKR